MLVEIPHPKKRRPEGVPAAVSRRFDTDPAACTGSVHLALTVLEQSGSGVAAGSSGLPRN